MSTLYFSEDEETEFLKKKRETHFHSGFGFLNSHNGFRRGNIHLFLGETSGGKSTLMRSLVRDLLFHPKNDCYVGLWLSEESIEEYKAMVSLGIPSNEKLMKSAIFSEIDYPETDETAFFRWLDAITPEILIYDNITTSKFYMDKRPAEQARFATKLKEAAKRLNMAVLTVAHTDSQTRPGLIQINHIRGSRTICNLAEFAYVLQRIKVKNDLYSTVRIVKHRSQDIMHDCYLFTYNHNFFSYTGDRDLQFDKFKEIYDLRNKL